MKKILLPIDGSANSLNAVRHAVNRYLNHEQLEFHLVHVRGALSRYIGRFVRRADRLGYHRDEAEKVLEPARKLLAQFSIPYCVHVEVGKRAATIVRLAEKLGIAEIIIGTARKNLLTRILEDSTTYKVLNSSSVPVQVVTNGEVSALQQYGVTATLAALAALMVVAME